MAGSEVRCGLTPPQACPYLPERSFQALLIEPGQLPPTAYRRLLDANFRRLGEHFYRPECPGCRACQQLRVDVAAFRPRRDQRRCAQRNRDLRSEPRPARLSEEYQDLYRRYQQSVHADPEADASRLCAGHGQDLLAIESRDASGRLLALSLVDTFPDAWSSVYCIYDPEQARRSLGTWAVLAEIELCKARGIAWLYLGYVIDDCQKMAYKARFLPHERWRERRYYRQEP